MVWCASGLDCCSVLIFKEEGREDSPEVAMRSHSTSRPSGMGNVGQKCLSFEKVPKGGSSFTESKEVKCILRVMADDEPWIHGRIGGVHKRWEMSTGRRCPWSSGMKVWVGRAIHKVLGSSWWLSQERLAGILGQSRGSWSEWGGHTEGAGGGACQQRTGLRCLLFNPKVCFFNFHWKPLLPSEVGHSTEVSKCDRRLQRHFDYLPWKEHICTVNLVFSIFKTPN